MDNNSHYNPEKYWENRYSKKFSLETSGYLGMGEEYNKWMYKAKIRALNKIIEKNKIDTKRKTILDVGVGTGFYINYWRQRGCSKIVGIDISTKSILALKKKHLIETFITLDISSPSLPIKGKFDIITAFDVLFHIVEENKFGQAIENLRKLSHRETKILIMDGFPMKPIRPGFHTNFRSLERYKKILQKNGMKIVDLVPIFYFMNHPVDKASNTYYLFIFLFRFFHVMNFFFLKFPFVGKILSYMLGAFLYYIDGFFLKFQKHNLSTKLALICVESSETPERE